MKESSRYLKMVFWSEEDQCFIGIAPGLFEGGCHGQDERAVFNELVEIVDEWIDIYKRDGESLPPSTIHLADQLRSGNQVAAE